MKKKLIAVVAIACMLFGCAKPQIKQDEVMDRVTINALIDCKLKVMEALRQTQTTYPTLLEILGRYRSDMFDKEKLTPKVKIIFENSCKIKAIISILGFMAFEKESLSVADVNEAVNLAREAKAAIEEMKVVDQDNKSKP